MNRYLNMQAYPAYLNEIFLKGRRQWLGASWGVFLISFIVYFITADRFVSFWDCPEYVVCGSRLEVGHPPGNPIWMLAMRVLTIPFPLQYHAFVINLASGLLMALASMLLARLCYFGAALLIRRNRLNLAVWPAIGGGLSFAFCDSAWFSAVEAEVYAMSAFLSLLTLWLMVRWFMTDSPGRRAQFIILISYIMGLSLGVHQLNLLVIPVLALFVCYRQSGRRVSFLKSAIYVAAGCVIVCLILFGVMNGSLFIAGIAELKAVNLFGLPPFSGVLGYMLLLLILFAIFPPIITRVNSDYLPLLIFPLLLTSGVFIFGQHNTAGLIISAVAALLLPFIPGLSKSRLQTIFFSLGFILLGYSSFTLILIRGYAAPPMNEGTPTDIFALASYIARDQYGSTPLLYGATPYSRPLTVEEFEEGHPIYRRYSLKRGNPRYVYAMPGARLYSGSGLTTPDDSARNAGMIAKGEGYLLADYTFKRVITPELDMWLPRITGSSPAHLESYESWIGMSKETMKEVRISEAVDSAGNAVGKLSADGERHKGVSYRPTYLQNLQMFLTYQAGYMYFRYLLWNFMGRQNDIPSTGEIEHGNFITGVPAIDEEMLGPSHLMPAHAWSDNKGHNNYYSIPFLLGLAGIVVLARSGRRGRRILSLSVLLFLMTGLAIVVYLNQTPGEPRERDYSFLISYATFAFWISSAGAGAASLFLRYPALRRAAVIIVSLVTPVMFVSINFDDHDRRHRGDPVALATQIIENNPNSIIFSQGDNYSFPLWYATEVEGLGKDCIIIDATYLGVPGYVVNLMRQGNLPMTATPADIAYGAYSFTRIAPDADTIPVPLIKALKSLYAAKEGAPTLRHSIVTLPSAAEDDSIVMNLHDFTSGGALIPFKKLMLLDIIATNLESPHPKRVAFLNRMLTELYRPLLPAMRQETFTTVYSPHSSPMQPEVAPMATPPNCLDPLVAEMAVHQRGCMVSHAKQILPSDTDGALRMLDMAAEAYPYSVIPPSSAPLRDSIFNEGLEYATLRMNLFEKGRNPRNIEEARKVIGMMLDDAKGWRRYYAALPEWRRHTVSQTTLRRISLIPRLEKACSRADSLINLPITQ